MTNEKTDQQPEKNSNQIGMWLVFGAGIGASLGVASIILQWVPLWGCPRFGFWRRVFAKK